MSGLLATRKRTAVAVATAACALLCVLLASGGVARAATTRTWLGGTDANWSTPANWSPPGPPVDGDSLVFPTTAGTKATNNDVVDLDLGSIEFAGSGYTISGDGLTVDNAISTDQGVGAVVSVPVTLGGAMTINAARFSVLTFDATPLSINLDGHNLTVQGDGQVNVEGDITGTANLSVLGPGALVLSGVTTYTGSTTVDGGTLSLSGGSIGPPGITTVFGGGAFGGTGSVGPLTVADALLFPGINGVPGAITTPALTLGAATTARFTLDSFAASGNDVVVVNGPVVLGGALLQLRWAFDTTVGDQFTLISGATSLSGTFAGLPEGAVFTQSGRRFSITYKGGAGHDVVVTRLAAAPVDLAISATPSASTFSPGQSVTFTLVATNKGPSDAPNVVVTVDLPDGLGFESVSAPDGYKCAVPLVGEAGQVKCNAPLLAAGDSATITVVARVLDSATGTLVTPAAVSSDGAETASADNSTTASIMVQGGAMPFHLRAAMVAKS